TLSASIMVSLVVSLTLTPMMCARLLKAEPKEPKPPGRLARWAEGGFAWMQDGYRRSLAWALAHSRLMMLILAAAVGLNVYLYTAVPKGFFPQQDTGQL
ncbi:efflux RND transporter permease subunit, partial [Campylobacter lari]|nr:efflux RND transporter permease subunit [Campylobacter lari]